MNERVLFDGYRVNVETVREACACGVDIVCDSASVDATMRAHQQESPHREWRAWQAALRPGPGPTAAGGDVSRPPVRPAGAGPK